jgi:hypothetical protein
MTRFLGSMHGFRQLTSLPCMLRGLLAILALAGAAAAQIQPGELLVNFFEALPNSRITRFHPDGTPVWTTSGGTGHHWEGCAITPQGHVVTARWFPVGVNVFDSNGTQINSFDTPEIFSFPGDVSVFADGTLAVTDQGGGGVDLYKESGAYLGSYATHAIHPFGSFIDSSDNLWLCCIHTSNYSTLHKISRAGAPLTTIAITFEAGDMVVAPDGTLWVSSRNDGRIVHLAVDGTTLGWFPSGVSGSFSGIALAMDGSLFVSGSDSTDVYHLSSSGTLLGTIPIGIKSLFLTVSPCGPEPIAYCTGKVNSLGCLPAISSTGHPSITMTSGFVVRGANVRNNKNGLLFYGTTGRSSLPFQGGTLCVKTPLKRTGSINSAGAPPPANDCSGVFSIDMNTFAHSPGPPVPLPALTVPGTTVDCQWWGRDQGFPAPSNTTLTDALEYVVCP